MKTLILSIILCLSASITKASFPPERIVDILDSGDGKTAKTAYQVYNVEEEYQLLEYLKLNPKMQMLSIIDGQYYDIIQVGERQIYFQLKLRSNLQIV
jgi:hypothetical protein